METKQVKQKSTVTIYDGISFISPVFWVEGGYGAFQKVGATYNLYDSDGDYFGFARSLGEACRKIEERGKKNERCN